MKSDFDLVHCNTNYMPGRNRMWIIMKRVLADLAIEVTTPVLSFIRQSDFIKLVKGCLQQIQSKWTSLKIQLFLL